jgi:poly(A) polymerase
VSEALAAARAALAGEPAWLVGGALRDRLLGRDTADLDLVVAGDVRAAARRLARGAGGASFPLSDAFGAWRVVGPGHAWHADLSPLRGATLEEDLALRDFTVNAIAEPLEGGALLTDPFGGVRDLEARALRMVSPEGFAADPLRVMRLARLGCELGFVPEVETTAGARAQAPGLEEVSPERTFAELKRIVCAPAALEGLGLMDDVGATAVVLPELAALRGVEQSRYHHLDVHDHTLAVLASVLQIERDPEPALAEHAPAVVEFLAQPLSDELTRAQALRFGAVLHDAAKPLTRGVMPDGRITFIGHDAAGAELARAALGRLRTSERLRSHVAALTRHHLRLGFLVHERPLSRRAIYRYLQACEPVEVDVTVLSVADRLATRGRGAEEAIAKHLELARQLLGEALRREDAGPAEPLIRGDDLARELGIDPGPELGTLLADLEEARFAGEVATREDAVERARAALRR